MNRKKKEQENNNARQENQQIDRQFEFKIFEDDVVRLRGRKGFGLVTQLAWESDSELSSSDSEEDSERLEPNHVRVNWVERLETSQPADQIEVIDRTFMHGDLVTLVTDPQGQIGTVVDVIVLANVYLFDGKDVKHVKEIDTTILKPIHSFHPGEYVVKDDSLLGIVDDCICDVELILEDGSRCTVEEANPDFLVPTDIQTLTDDFEIDNGSYYPSQDVSVKTEILKKAKWIKGNYACVVGGGTGSKRGRIKGKRRNRRKKKEFKAKVLKVVPKTVIVNWSSSNNILVANEMPSGTCAPSEIVVLDYFESTKWQIGDHCLFQTSEFETHKSDEKTKETKHTHQQFNPAEKKLPTNKVQPIYRKGNSRSKRVRQKAKSKLEKEATNYLNDSGIITRTKTIVQVLWQDGSHSDGILATELMPYDLLMDHFFPNDYVLHMETNKTGTVKKVNAKDRTCIVRWLSAAESALMDRPQISEVSQNGMIQCRTFPIYDHDKKVVNVCEEKNERT